MRPILPEDLTRLRAHLYRISGIYVDEDKSYLLDSRLRTRMDALDMERFDDYFRYLVLGPAKGELQELINCVTVNETYFFRDYGQLSRFAEEVLPMVLEPKRAAGQTTLKILSAGCSTGEEAYSLAIIIREMVDDLHRWTVTIDALDINTDVLDHARRGLYGPRSTRDVPTTFRLRYFEEEGADLRLKPIARDMVRLDYGNLYDPAYMAKHAGVDVVFCRNVLLYFDDTSRVRVINNLYNLLNPGGFLFLGYAESVSRYSAAFEVVRLGNLFVHRKPLQSREDRT